jgi:hypothetical protein
MKPETIVDILLETTDDEQRPVDSVKGMPKEPDDSFDVRDYALTTARFGSSLNAIVAKAKEADELYAKSRRALMFRLPTLGDEHRARIVANLNHLDQLYAERHHKLAQIQYAMNYRAALRKAGVKPEDVAQKFTARVDKPGQLVKVVMNEVELKDGRRVRLEPFEIPRELLKP